MRRTFGSIATITTVVAVMLAPSASFATSISASKLSSELLTLGQMPTGWTSSSTTDDGLGCLHNLLEPSGVKQTHASQAYFLGTVDQLPKFDEKIATYANVKTAYKKIIARINSCHVTDGLVNGVMVTGTVAPMSFAHFGNASSTYAMVDSDVRGTFGRCLRVSVSREQRRVQTLLMENPAVRRQCGTSSLRRVQGTRNWLLGTNESNATWLCHQRCEHVDDRCVRRTSGHRPCADHHGRRQSRECGRSAQTRRPP